MTIIYSLVARGSTVLAEFTNAKGNFTTVTRRILEKIPQQDGKMSYTYDRSYFLFLSPFFLIVRKFFCLAFAFSYDWKIDQTTKWFLPID
jgi:CRISPR/Cas system endoribonuclease Cas6 (RAMP superfamily)